MDCNESFWELIITEELKRVGQRSGNCLESRWRANSQRPDQLQSAVWASKSSPCNGTLCILARSSPECHSHQLCQKALQFLCMLSAHHLSFLQRRLSSLPRHLAQQLRSHGLHPYPKTSWIFFENYGQGISSWWFQPIWNILVKPDHLPK